MKIQQVFPSAPFPSTGEIFERLLDAQHLSIERILSAPGAASGPYDQTQDEWVLLLQGEALMEVAGERVALTAGQAIHLPAHCIHQVLNTSTEPPCLWLAVHIKDSSHTTDNR